MLRRLRPHTGLIMVGAGMFTLALAALLPTVVYPRVAVLPFDPQAKQVVRGEGMDVVFPRHVNDGGTRQLWDVAVTNTVYVSADRRFTVDADSDRVRWTVATVTAVDDLGTLQATVEGICLDRRRTHTAAGCPGYLLTKQGDRKGEVLQHSGFAFMFPFDTQKQDYPLWDANVRRTETARYAGEDERRGLRVYRFEQTVPNTVIGSQALPGSFFGLDAPSVTAQTHYRTHRTWWIEPNSGAMIDYEEDLDRRFVYAGKEIPMIQGTVRKVQRDDDPVVELAQLAAFGLPWVKSRLSWVLAPIAVTMVIAGLVLHRRRHGAGRDDWDEPDLLRDHRDSLTPVIAGGRGQAGQESAGFARRRR